MALEALVGADLTLDVEVNWRSVPARVTRARDPDALSVLDPRGDVHIPGAPPGARVRRRRTRRTARPGSCPRRCRSTGRRADHPPERRSRDLLDDPLAAARPAGLDGRARLGAVSAAVLAAGDGLERDLLAEFSSTSASSISTATARSPPAAGPRRPNPNSPRTAGRPGRRRRRGCPRTRRRWPRGEAAGAQALVPERVVGPPACPGRPGTIRFLELLLGGRVVLVHVWVQLARHPPEGLLDLRVGGAPVDPEDLVVVARHYGRGS